jgi:hypothetical protein
MHKTSPKLSSRSKAAAPSMANGYDKMFDTSRIFQCPRRFNQQPKYLSPGQKFGAGSECETASARTVASLSASSRALLEIFDLVAGAVGGGAVAVPLASSAAATVGFTGAGILAGSPAAAMMAAAAVANGGGVASFSAVAGLQSVGAVGLAPSTAAGMAVLGTFELEGLLLVQAPCWLGRMVGSTLGVYNLGLIFVSARTNKRHHHHIGLAWDRGVKMAFCPYY